MTLRLSKQGLLGFGRCLPCTIGKTGVTTSKREGDGATPAGIMTVEGMYYRPDRLPCPANWAVPILPGDLWSDASEAPEYNHHVRAPYASSHETLKRADPLYDLFMIMMERELKVKASISNEPHIKPIALSRFYRRMIGKNWFGYYFSLLLVEFRLNFIVFCQSLLCCINLG